MSRRHCYAQKSIRLRFAFEWLNQSVLEVRAPRLIFGRTTPLSGVAIGNFWSRQFEPLSTQSKTPAINLLFVFDLQSSHFSIAAWDQ
jgi:hypothetical protein